MCESIKEKLRKLQVLAENGQEGEADIDDKQKEVEDLMKAVWYLEDYLKQLKEVKGEHRTRGLRHPCGRESYEVSRYFPTNIACAINYLWLCGLVIDGNVTHFKNERTFVGAAVIHIQMRIKECKEYEGESERD